MENTFSAQATRFEVRLSNCDPANLVEQLEIWESYVLWLKARRGAAAARASSSMNLQETKSPGMTSRKSNLQAVQDADFIQAHYLQVLQRFTSDEKLMDAFQTTSPSYVRIVLEYVKEFVPGEKTHNALQTLSLNQMGLRVAIFYEAWAHFLEENNMIEEADNVLETGVKREAQPFNQIKASYDLFLQRTRQKEQKIDTSQKVSQINSHNEIRRYFFEDLFPKGQETECEFQFEEIRARTKCIIPNESINFRYTKRNSHNELRRYWGFFTVDSEGNETQFEEHRLNYVLQRRRLEELYGEEPDENLPNGENVQEETQPKQLDLKLKIELDKLPPSTLQSALAPAHLRVFNTPEHLRGALAERIHKEQSAERSVRAKAEQKHARHLKVRQNEFEYATSPLALVSNEFHKLLFQRSVEKKQFGNRVPQSVSTPIKHELQPLPTEKSMSSSPNFEMNNSLNLSSFDDFDNTNDLKTSNLAMLSLDFGSRPFSQTANGAIGDADDIVFEPPPPIPSDLSGFDAEKGVMRNPFSTQHQQKLLQIILTDPNKQLHGFFVYPPREFSPKLPIKKGIVMTVRLGKYFYRVQSVAFSGGFAKIHFALMINSQEKCAYAMKVQAPPCLWEYYIAEELQKRLPYEERIRFMPFHEIHLYQDKSIIVMNFNSAGSLHDVINQHLSSQRKMDEAFTMFYTIEMLKILQSLTKAKVIHADMKPDNFLIRNCEPGVISDWCRDGSGGWAEQGLKLVDFGCCIDAALYPEGAKFIGRGHASTFDCLEMRNGTPWSKQADAFGIAGVIHCMLFGDFMDVLQNPSGLWMPKNQFKRYWATDIWVPLFQDLLNYGDKFDPASYQTSMEDHLTANPSKAQTIRNCIIQQRTKLHLLNSQFHV